VSHASGTFKKEWEASGEEIYEQNVFGDVRGDALGRTHREDAWRHKLPRRHVAGGVIVGEGTPCQRGTSLRDCG